MLNRIQLEFIVFGITTLHFVSRIGTSHIDSLILICLTLLSCLLEYYLIQLKNNNKIIQNSFFWEFWGSCREADSQGVAQGLLALPWLFGGLVIFNSKFLQFEKNEEISQNLIHGYRENLNYDENIQKNQNFLEFLVCLFRISVFSSCIVINQFRNGIISIGAGIVGLVIVSPDFFQNSANWLLQTKDEKNGTGIQVQFLDDSLEFNNNNQFNINNNFNYNQFFSPTIQESLFIISVGVFSFILFNQLMVKCEKTFTFGEGVIVSQGFAFLTIIAIQQLIKQFSNFEGFFKIPKFNQTDIFVIFLMWGMLCFAIKLGPQTKKLGKYFIKKQKPPNLLIIQIILISIIAICMLIKPAISVILYVVTSHVRIALLAYWLIVLLLSLPLIQLLSKINMLPNILIRKGFHLLAVALFLPAVIIDINFLKISLAIAFAALIVLELIRISNIPIIGKYIHAFMHNFVDARDAGSFYVTHFSLLLGMSLPVWLVPNIVPNIENNNININFLQQQEQQISQQNQYVDYIQIENQESSSYFQDVNNANFKTISDDFYVGFLYEVISQFYQFVVAKFSLIFGIFGKYCGIANNLNSITNFDYLNSFFKQYFISTYQFILNKVILISNFIFYDQNQQSSHESLQVNIDSTFSHSDNFYNQNSQNHQIFNNNQYQLNNQIIIIILSGVLALGIADTAASVFGQTIGRTKICQGVKKTWEGTFGGIFCVLFSIYLMQCMDMFQILSMDQWYKWIWCTMLSCMLEAVTTQLDNIVLPLHYLGLLLALQ